MLIRNIDLNGRIADVRLVDQKIAEVGTDLKHAADEPILEGQGGALLPGLHDHHIHLNASAAALNSVHCGPPEVKNLEELAVALNAVSDSVWLRGIGYHASIGTIDRHWLDEHGPNRPVRIQHRGGRMWIFNSQGMEIVGEGIPDNGQLIDGDRAVQAALKNEFPDLRDLMDKLLRYGITGVTEVTPNNGINEFRRYIQHTHPLKIIVMGKAELADLNDDRIGPLKLHYHDYELPALDDLSAEIAAAHETGRAVAVHCVTRAELMLTLAALEQAGPIAGDRIEHAAIADADLIAWMARLGVIVVTQPHFICEREEAYLQDVEAQEQPHLWPIKSLMDAGLPLAAGSDAPFGKLNPWASMGAAVNRPDNLGPDEAVTPEQALALYTKPAGNAGAPPRSVDVGSAADLCLIDRSWSEARRDLSQVQIVASWIDGVLVYDRISSTRPQSRAV